MPIAEIAGAATRATPDHTVSVVIRHHDARAVARLERAIQSLHGQSGAVVQPIVVTQRFSEDDLELTRRAVARQWFFTDLPAPIVINLDDGLTRDARSDLLNAGIDKHFEQGNRYLAFLDYDDLMYSHAYRVLIERLEKSGASIAFASVDVADVVPLADYEFIYRLSDRYAGSNKLDLLRSNFCPLHSYLVDTARVDRTLLTFNPELTRVEDYDFLLRVAGQNPCDFSALGIKIGLYMHRADGSNSTPTGEGSVTDREVGTNWKDSIEVLDRLRASYPVRFFASDFTA